MKNRLLSAVFILGMCAILFSCKNVETYSWWKGISERDNRNNTTQAFSKGENSRGQTEYESFTYSEDFDNPYGVLVCNLKHLYTGPNSSKQDYEIQLVRKGNKLYPCRNNPDKYIHYKDEKGKSKKVINEVWKNKALSYDSEPMYTVERYSNLSGTFLELTLENSLTTIVFELAGETEEFKKIDEYKTYWRNQ